MCVKEGGRWAKARNSCERHTHAHTHTHTLTHTTTTYPQCPHEDRYSQHTPASTLRVCFVGHKWPGTARLSAGSAECHTRRPETRGYEWRMQRRCPCRRKHTEEVHTLPNAELQGHIANASATGAKKQQRTHDCVALCPAVVWERHAALGARCGAVTWTWKDPDRRAQGVATAPDWLWCDIHASRSSTVSS